MPLHPRRCCFLYSVSCLLDAVDGVAARRFQQSTKFGAILDMVTDRCTTACLLVFLASAFPRYAIIFQGLISLDLASHYVHMYATLAMGGSGQSHKKVDEGRSWILKQYYSNNVSLDIRSPGQVVQGKLRRLTLLQKVLFTFCALNELFFIALYLLSFSSPLISPQLLETVPAPNGTATKGQLFMHPWSAGAMELAR